LLCPDATTTKIDSKRIRMNIQKGGDLAKKVLSTSYYVSLGGDESVYIHDLTSKLKITNKKEKKGIMKCFTDAHDTSLQTAQINHDKIRFSLRIQLKTLIKILQDSPGLVGPKFQLVLCLLNLSKNEILWYFRHKGKKTKKKVEEITETNLSEFVYLMDEMTQFTLKHKKIVTDYHLNFLKGLYTNKINSLLEKLENNSIKIGEIPLKIVKSILQDISGTTSFGLLRSSWKKASIMLCETLGIIYFL
jgi:hypothetical protein